MRAKVIALVSAVVLAALLPAPAQASPWVHIFIEHLPAGTCLAIPDAADGSVPSEVPCVDTGYQLWTFEDAGTSRYRLRNTATGKCLAANGTTALHQLTCGSGPNYLWQLTGTGHIYRISSVSAAKCIARQGLAGAVVLGTCVPTAAQWHLLY